MRHYRFGWLILGSLILTGAAPHSPADFVRAGNAAFHAEDFNLALDYYTQAEERTTDPGLVAFEKAATYYRLGQFHQAERHYVRGLEDAEGDRRARALYDVGNAVLMQAIALKNDVKRFNQAIHFYKDCLRQPTASDALREDARHNLKLCEALRSRAKPSDEPPDEKDPDKKPEKPDEGDSNQQDVPRGLAPGEMEDPDGKIHQLGKNKSMKGAKVSKRPTPGTGNLEPIPDQDALKSLPPEEAAEHLRRAAERILAERKQSRQVKPPNSKNVLNW